MQIENKTVVSISYNLTNKEGQVLDSSQGLEPLSYLHGYGNIIPGLEQGLLGAKLNDELTIEVMPEEGYGEYDASLVQEIPLTKLEHLPNLKVGSFIEINTPEGVQIASLVELSETTATLDTNHPLAGELLVFNIKVEALRQATAEELEQGVVILPS